MPQLICRLMFRLMFTVERESANVLLINDPQFRLHRAFRWPVSGSYKTAVSNKAWDCSRRAEVLGPRA